MIHAREERHVIRTNDQDFLRLAAGGEEHAGIVLGSPRTSVGEWVTFLELLCKVYTAEEMQNHVEYV